ncbi:MAG: hypothetical protein E7165_01615 [Firmicutes bacterium]|nr:hypothetical protein [Bacillota bacterium]
MEKTNYFKQELNYVFDTRLRENAIKLINLLPDYFFEIPASSTGKYHPQFALGEGGLVRHTKAAVRFAYELLNNNCIGNVFNEREKDLIIMSIIMHDGCKSGLTKSEYTVANHPLIVSKLIKDNQDKLTLNEEELNLLCSMIESHMGEFNKDYRGNSILPLPQNRYQKFVHMCDYLASKKFLDIKFDGNEIIE